jgi:hypothetical protein
MTRVVTAFCRFNFYDIRTKITEHDTARRPHHHVGTFDYPHAIEW